MKADTIIYHYMSKELPFFKFNPSQWLSGRISLEDFTMQGIFINVCSVYWANDCNIKIATLKKRYGQAIETLIAENFIKDNNGTASIDWLDFEHYECSTSHQKNSQNGKAGADARWGKNGGANGEANGEAIALRKEKKRKEKKKSPNPVFFKPAEGVEAMCPISELAKEYMANDQAVINASVLLRIDKESILPAMIEFVKELSGRQVKAKTKTDFNDHFINYTRKQLQKSASKPVLYDGHDLN